nr:exodeoxyribonuclease VII small subunit [Anaerolineae bacterium]
MTRKPALTFEEALAQLEEAVARLEAGGLTLEESLSLFERGQELAGLCEQMLDAATLRIEELNIHPPTTEPGS